MAQQDPVYTQYMFNNFLINPAYAGSHDRLSFTAHSRIQWMGFDGAPTTHVFTGHHLMKNQINGVGGTLQYEEIGATTVVGASGSFSHRILLNNGTLSLGIRAGVESYQTAFSGLDVEDQSDEVFMEDHTSILPNFGTGAYYYTDDYYIGLSIPRFIHNPLRSDVELSEGRRQRHYFLYGGYVFPVGEHMKLKPNTLVRWVSGAPVQFDFNVNALFYETLWLGVSYRTQESIGLLFEIMMGDNLRMGYSYDVGINHMAQYHNGTHEMMINFRLNTSGKGKSQAKPYSPRDF